jgi:hypothetical protein
MAHNSEQWYFVARCGSTGQVLGRRQRVRGYFQAQKKADERNKNLTPEERNEGKYDIEPADPPIALTGPHRAPNKWRGSDNRRNRSS